MPSPQNCLVWKSQNNVQDTLNVLEWKEAFLEEMKVPDKNESWAVVDMPKGKRILGYK